AALSSSDPAVSVPASVPVSVGAASVSFNIATSVVTASKQVTITAVYKGVTRTAVLTVTPAVTTGGATSIWNNSFAPTNVDADNSSVELGVKFRSDSAGYIKGIRFYKNGKNTGTHTGTLWSSTGTKLASATFKNETASGWQQVTFSTSVKIT